MRMLDFSAIQWRKSSHSSGQGGECVEVGTVPWQKSSHSTAQGGDCVEVAELSGKIAIRDSKNPARAVLTFDSAAFGAFLGRCRSYPQS
jgi:hypothetical protein